MQQMQMGFWQILGGTLISGSERLMLHNQIHAESRMLESDLQAPDVASEIVLKKPRNQPLTVEEPPDLIRLPTPQDAAASDAEHVPQHQSTSTATDDATKCGATQSTTG